MNWIMVAASVLVTIPTASFAETFLYTPTRGPGCIDRSKPSLEVRTCAGVAGFAVVLSDEGNLVSFGIRYPGEPSVPSAHVWRGAGQMFGELVEWRMEGGSPTHAVLRAWRTTTAKDGSESVANELLVFRVRRSASCLVGSIDVRKPNANFAAHLTMREPDRPCLIDN